MKRPTGFFGLFFLLILLFPSAIFADTVTTGNSSVTSTTTTNVQSSGNVHTHMESTVNGVTKVFDSDQPGTYTLENSDNNASSTSTTSTNNTNNPTPTLTPTISPTPHPTHIPKSHPTQNISKLQQIFHNAIQKILSIFHL